MSNADGSQWKLLAGNEVPNVMFNNAKLFIVDDEIFIKGSEEQLNGKGQHKIIQWLDLSAKRWVTVWSEDPRSTKSPITLIQVTLADQKTLLLPIAR
jgi:hypothetical protein